MSKDGRDEGLKQHQRIGAAENQRPDKQAPRNTLRSLPDDATSANPDLGSSIRARFAPLGGIELELPPRELIRNPPHFN
ncbi:MAG: plasmid stabilization protein [Chloroflexi bacterium]|nr:plasmid stabilization protein [Chloroflexota bacterium]